MTAPPMPIFVGGFNFRKMIKNLHGEYVCPSCDHVDHPRVECNCDRCEQIRYSGECRTRAPELQTKEA